MMTRKRKAAAVSEAPEDPAAQPEPELPEPVDIQQPPEEDLSVGEGEGGASAAEAEEEGGEGEEKEDEAPVNTAEIESEAVKTDQQVELTEKPSEIDPVPEKEVGPVNMEENESEAVKNDQQQAELTEKPSEIAAVPEIGVGEEDDGEEEEPLEKILEPFSKVQLSLLVKEAVAKHPDLIEAVHKLADADPAHRKIFVHGLGWESSDESITASFSKYGEVEDCKLVKDKVSGKSKGYAFLLFKRRSGARRALKEPQRVMDGRIVSCQLASEGPVRAPTASVVAAVPASKETEYTRRKIYVTNVSAEIDPNKLTEFFSTFGEIEEGPLGLDKQTGKPRGFCLFVYKSLSSAHKALEEPHKTFEGHTLHCQKAVDGPKHSKGASNQQQQGHQPRHHQGNHRHSAKKGRYFGGGEGVGPAGGNMMGPNAGYNQAVAPAAIGQAVAALLATQGAGLGIGNLLGGVNQQGMSPMMNNVGYGGHPGGYGAPPGMQGGYGGQPQMGRGGVRPPYMGPGR